MHKALQDYASTTMPAEMNLRVFLNTNGFILSGVYYGTQENFRSAIAPLLSKPPFAGVDGQVSTMGWIDALTNYAYAPMVTALDYDVVSR